MALQSTNNKKAPIHQLAIADPFSSLSNYEKLYAHHLSRAAWNGTRIIMRQVSPESIGIFDLILELHSFCSGNWSIYCEKYDIDVNELEAFLEYASTFLSNVGNYYGSGDQKIIPNVSRNFLDRLADLSPGIQSLYHAVAIPMIATPPFGLGIPSELAQSAYYPGNERITEEEIAVISHALEVKGMFPENTRIRKVKCSPQPHFEVLVASIQRDGHHSRFDLPEINGTIQIIYGDHAVELERICSSLREAVKYCRNDLQISFLEQYIQSFQTGDLDAYRESQRTWIKDTAPRVENIFGFVEPYRDPFGTRAEFEGLVGIADLEETKKLQLLVENSDKFIRRLPWIDPSSLENHGKGPFEKALFDPPDFASIHTIAYCSSIIFPGINLPNYNDIRQSHGFKNVIIANRMSAESSSAVISPFVNSSEAASFQTLKYTTYYWWVVLHEVFGHGTGKLLHEYEPQKYDFDIDKRPINPLTGNEIESWYKAGQTWTGQFGDLATTVDECRAELVGAYLMDDKELLELVGFPHGGPIEPEDSTLYLGAAERFNENPDTATVTYNLYLQLGVDGLRGLGDFNVANGKWGQAHSRAHFAILKHLLIDGDGVLTIHCVPATHTLSVHVDRNKIIPHGKSAIGRMLLKLHIYRCTADVQSCRTYYEELSRVEDEHMQWRQMVIEKVQPKWVFSQPNTFLDGDSVVLKEYPPTPEGVIQSWAERKV